MALQKIIMVDDEFGIISSLKTLLMAQLAGSGDTRDIEDIFSYYTDPAEALKNIEIDENTQTMLIVDYLMPKMNGIELLKEGTTNKKWRKANIMMFSGNTTHLSDEDSQFLQSIAAKTIQKLDIMLAVEDILSFLGEDE